MGLILLIIIILLGVLVFVLRMMFSIERVEVDTPLPDPVSFPVENEAEDEVEQAEDEEEEKSGPAEMVNLFDYFDEENEPASLESEAKEPVEAAAGAPAEASSGADAEASSKAVAEAAAEVSADAPAETSSENAPEADTESYYIALDKLTDFKTGRRYLIDCKKMLESARDDGHIYCACYFDFDRFSYINSLKGNSTGDYVITQASLHIRRIFPEGSLLSRISCDHFVAVFPVSDLAQFNDFYEQLRRMCDKIRNDIAAKSGLRVCVGFATTDNDSSYDVSVLLNRANIARHCVKITKAEKFEIFESSMIETNFFGDCLMDTYSECQYGDDFVVYFERQVDLSSNKVVACDSLVRWSYDDKPTNALTADNGKIPSNNDKVIYKICHYVSRWRKAGRESVLMFVDINVIDFYKTDLDEFLGKCLTEFQIEPQSLVAKLDVSIIRLDWSSCSKHIKKLHEMGVKVCVSGMDTGYTSLEFLAGLSIDYIKLHKSFAHDADKSAEQLDKCRKIIGRAADIGAKVIFEGVDTVDQVTALRGAGAKIVTGKYTGKLATADDLTRELPEHIERRSSDTTVVLDDAQLAKGDFNLF